LVFEIARKTKRWSISKILFIVNRYFGNMVLITHAIVLFHPRSARTRERCTRYLRFTAWSNIILFWNTQLIMMFRIFILHGRSRWILATLLVVSASELAVFIAATILTESDLRDFSNSNIPCDLLVCIAKPLRRYNSSVWLSTAVVEVILFVLAFSVCLRHFRELRALGQWNPRSLLGVLFHDSIFYILIALTAHVSAAFLWYLAPDQFQVPSGLNIAIICVLGSRLVLNLRQACYFPDTHRAQWGSSNWRASPDLHSAVFNRDQDEDCIQDSEGFGRRHEDILQSFEGDRIGGEETGHQRTGSTSLPDNRALDEKGKTKEENNSVVEEPLDRDVRTRGNSLYLIRTECGEAKSL